MPVVERRIVNFYKAIIISVAALLFVFPWWLSVTALARVNQLQKQVDGLIQKANSGGVSETRTTVPEDPGSADAVVVGDKVVYLTFDDGPSQTTGAILDTLKQYGVGATFFVIGKADSQSADLYRRILNDGHSLGIHSYSHNYTSIYASVDACMNDINKLALHLLATTGTSPNLYRFPGGSSNTIAGKGVVSGVAAKLAERGITYFDWNVDSGDSKATRLTADQIVDRVVSGVSGKQQAIVLMHDSATKVNTAEALPRIIETLQSQGYVFARLTSETKPVQHRQFNLVGMSIPQLDQEVGRYE